MEYSIAEVCLLGMGIVFFGLICLVGLIWVIGNLFRERKPSAEDTPAEPEREDESLKVAITAALAEYLKVEYQAVKVRSIAVHKEET